MRIKSWLILISLCMVAAVILSGCLGVKTPPVTRSAPPGILVDYLRTGGIAGVNDRVVIFDNGITVISTRQFNSELTLNQSELERIGALFGENKFSTLDTNYTSRRGGADFMHYSVSYHGKTVNAEDTATPPLLQPIIDEMNSILARGSAANQTVSALPSIPS
jgi:hypothetical protein